MNQTISLNETIKFFTDTATLAVFDPATMQERIHSEADWWCNGDLKNLEEVRNGLISIVSVSNDGYYKVRVTTESLTQDEKDFSRCVIGPLGVASKSEKVFIGKGECLPGGDYLISPKDISSGDGKFIELPAGNYDLYFYFVNAAGYASESKVKSLPDIVVTIVNRTNTFLNVNTEPRIDSTIETFLFPSKKNASKLKPKLNKILKAKVWSTTRTTSGKAIKEISGSFWPDEYRSFEIILEDMSQVEWGDRITIKTTRLDEENKIIYAELIERLPK